MEIHRPVAFNPGSVRASLIDPDPETQACLDAECLKDGLLLVKPAAFYAPFRQDDLSAFCVRHGFYCLPTDELIAFLLNEIGDRSAIEIGSGNGAIGRALGIPRTDSMQQERAEIQELYRSIGQKPITYPPDVGKMTALEAAEHYKPKVVVAAWVTHKFDPEEPARQGNQWGVDERKLLAKRFVKTYIHIGHAAVHKHKKIRGMPHQEIWAPWLFSRSKLAHQNVLWVWNLSRKR